MESLTCGYLSAVVVVALLVQLFVGAWWVSGASALVLVPFLLREAREAWRRMTAAMIDKHGAIVAVALVRSCRAFRA